MGYINLSEEEYEKIKIRIFLYGMGFGMIMCGAVFTLKDLVK